MNKLLIVSLALILVASVVAAPLKSSQNQKRNMLKRGTPSASLIAAAQTHSYDGMKLQGSSNSRLFQSSGHYQGQNKRVSVTYNNQRYASPKRFKTAQRQVIRREVTIAPSSQTSYSNSRSWDESHQGKKVAWQEEAIISEEWYETIYHVENIQETHYITESDVEYTRQWNIQARNQHGVGTCRNFWYQSSFSLDDAQGTAGEWYLNNCQVYSEFYGQYISAKDIEWSNPDAEAFYYSNWVCASDSSWRIYFPQNCTWVKGTFVDGQMYTPPPATPTPAVTSSMFASIPSTIPTTPLVITVPSTATSVYIPPYVSIITIGPNTIVPSSIPVVTLPPSVTIVSIPSSVTPATYLIPSITPSVTSIYIPPSITVITIGPNTILPSTIPVITIPASVTIVSIPSTVTPATQLIPLIPSTATSISIPASIEVITIGPNTIVPSYISVITIPPSVEIVTVPTCAVCVNQPSTPGHWTYITYHTHVTYTKLPSSVSPVVTLHLTQVPSTVTIPSTIITVPPVPTEKVPSTVVYIPVSQLTYLPTTILTVISIPSTIITEVPKSLIARSCACQITPSTPGHWEWRSIYVTPVKTVTPTQTWFLPSTVVSVPSTIAVPESS